MELILSHYSVFAGGAIGLFAILVTILAVHHIRSEKLRKILDYKRAINSQRRDLTYLRKKLAEAEAAASHRPE